MDDLSGNKKKKGEVTIVGAAAVVLQYVSALSLM